MKWPVEIGIRLESKPKFQGDSGGAVVEEFFPEEASGNEGTTNSRGTVGLVEKLGGEDGVNGVLKLGLDYDRGWRSSALNPKRSSARCLGLPVTTTGATAKCAI
jgi:hypothetical protein